MGIRPLQRKARQPRQRQRVLRPGKAQAVQPGVEFHMRPGRRAQGAGRRGRRPALFFPADGEQDIPRNQKRQIFAPRRAQQQNLRPWSRLSSQQRLLRRSHGEPIRPRGGKRLHGMKKAQPVGIGLYNAN